MGYIVRLFLIEMIIKVDCFLLIRLKIWGVMRRIGIMRVVWF